MSVKFCHASFEKITAKGDKGLQIGSSNFVQFLKSYCLSKSPHDVTAHDKSSLKFSFHIFSKQSLLFDPRLVFFPKSFYPSLGSVAAAPASVNLPSSLCHLAKDSAPGIRPSG